MIKEIKKIKDTVELILTREPETRDSDQLLALKVWAKQNPNLRDPNLSFIAFATGFKAGKYANYESIRRSRALIQKDREDLRGESYSKRTELDTDTRNEINKL
jgi:hypothetical protein